MLPASVMEIASVRSIFSSSSAFVRRGNADSSFGIDVLNRSGSGGIHRVIDRSSRIVLPRGGGRHESVDQAPQFDKSIHRKAWTGYDSNYACSRGGHPLGEQTLCSITWLADDQMTAATMLSFADDVYRLAGEWVKGVGD